MKRYKLKLPRSGLLEFKSVPGLRIGRFPERESLGRNQVIGAFGQGGLI